MSERSGASNFTTFGTYLQQQGKGRFATRLGKCSLACYAAATITFFILNTLVTSRQGADDHFICVCRDCSVGDMMGQ